MQQDNLTKNDTEEGEIIDNNEINNKNKPEHATLDINKFIERQNQLKTNQINRRKINAIASENSISEKSLEVAKKISDSVLQKNSKKNDVNHRKKIRKDSEVSNISEENCDNVVNDSQTNESGSEYYPSDDCQTGNYFKIVISYLK